MVLALPAVVDIGQGGAKLAIVNREPTEFDDIADLVVREDIGTVFAPFVDAASSTDVHRA